MTPRHPSIDGMRGLAVMGILLMNVTGFALPSGAYFNPAALGPPSAADIGVWATTFVLVDGKVRALFSMLFGASTLLIVRSAEAGGRDPVRVHTARMGTLLLFGIVHALVWPGDILIHYAIVGMAALPLAALEPRQLVKVAILLIVAQALVQGWLLLGDAALHARALADPAAAARWRDFAAGVGIGDASHLAAEVARHRGGFGALVIGNARDIATGVPFVLVFDGPETLAYMAIGMALLPALAVPRRRLLPALAAIGAGTAIAAALAVAVERSGFATLPTFAAATIGGILSRPAMAIGFALLAAPWLARDGAAQRRLAAVGRLAFSNYLATTLVMTALFDGWGFGLFGRLTRVQCYAVVPVAWAAMLLWSPWWARRFRYGPMEWCWRSLARGRPVTMRKAIASMMQ